MGGVRAGPAQLVPVHPVLSWRQPAEGDEGLAQQQGVLPEGPVAQNPQVDDPLLQVALGDPLVHQLGVGGGVSTRTSSFHHTHTLPSGAAGNDGFQCPGPAERGSLTLPSCARLVANTT